MNRPWIQIQTLTLGLLLSLPAWDSLSGATEDEASARYLAITIAAEAGGHPDQYLSYARELSVTLVGMTSNEQEEVIGFTPPIANADTLAEQEEESSSSSGSDGSGNELETNTDSSAWFGEEEETTSPENSGDGETDPYSETEEDPSQDDGDTQSWSNWFKWLQSWFR